MGLAVDAISQGCQDCLMVPLRLERGEASAPASRSARKLRRTIPVADPLPDAVPVDVLATEALGATS